MGFLLRQQDRLAEARIELEKAIALNHNNANAFTNSDLICVGRDKNSPSFLEGSRISSSAAPCSA